MTFTDGNYVDVYLNGVMLKAGVDYVTTTANTIGSLAATVASDVVDVIVYDTFSLFGGTLEGNVTVSNGTLDVSGDITGSTLNADGDTAAGDNAAIGYTSAEGLILTGQGSTSDITLKNDADATVFTVPTGTDDILFPDNAKAMFGAGSDLQIYHDGSHSYVSDQGTGQLILLSDSFRVNNAANSENIITAEENGAVNLFYNDSKKLETTSSGVTVTGTVATSDGSNSAPAYTFSDDTDTGMYSNYANNIAFATGGTVAGIIDANQNMDWQADVSLAHDGAVLSFGAGKEISLTHVHDVGLNLTGKLGINAATPSPDYGTDSAIEIKGATSPGLVINDTGQGSKYGIHADSNDLKITYGSGTLATFQNDGRVGIGVTAPTGKLTIANPTGYAPNTVTAGNAYIQLGNTDYGSGGSSSNDGKFMVGFGYTDGSTNTHSPAYIGYEETSTSGDTKGNLTFYTRDVVTDTAPTKRMTIASDGVVTLTSSTTTSYATDDDGISNYLVLNSTGTSSSQNVGIQFSLNKSGETGAITEIGALRTANGESAFVIRTRDSSTGRNERMRVSADGEVLFGCTSTSAPSYYFAPDSGGGSFKSIKDSTNSRTHFEFHNTNGTIGTITTSGSATAYNTSSDYRLKENVSYDWNATSRLKQLKPSRFNFKADKDATVDGFLAHEVSSIVPEAVTGTKDEVDEDGNAVMQGIDQSKLVPLLVKTIQELEARIAKLEGA